MRTKDAVGSSSKSVTVAGGTVVPEDGADGTWWLEVEGMDGWLVFVTVDRMGRVRELRVAEDQRPRHTGTPKRTEQAGITANLIRRIPFEPLRAAIMADMAGTATGMIRHEWPGPAFTERSELEDRVRSMEPHAKTGRRRLSDSELARRAEAYVNALEQTGGAGAVEVAAAALVLDGKTLRSSLTRARKIGLLTSPPSRGLSGGHLTPRALSLLGQT